MPQTFSKAHFPKQSLAEAAVRVSCPVHATGATYRKLWPCGRSTLLVYTFFAI